MDDDDDYADSDVNGGAPKDDDDWTYDPNSGVSAAAQAGFPDSPYPNYPGDPDQMTDDERTVFRPVVDYNSTAPIDPAGLQPLLDPYGTLAASASPYTTGLLGVPNMAPTTYDTGLLSVPGMGPGGANPPQGYGLGPLTSSSTDGLSDSSIVSGQTSPYLTGQLGVPNMTPTTYNTGSLSVPTTDIYGGAGNDPLVVPTYQPTASDYQAWANSIVGQPTAVGNVTAASGDASGLTVDAKPLSFWDHLRNIGGDLVHGDFGDAGQEAGVVANHIFGSPLTGATNYYGLTGGGFHPSDGVQTPADLGQQQHALASSAGNSIGGWAGGSLEGGMGGRGFSAQASLGHMYYPDGETALLKTYGGNLAPLGAAYPGKPTASALLNPNGQTVFGGAGGLSAGAAFSNALGPNDSLGPATAYNLNAGPVAASLSLDGNHHYSLGLGFSPDPLSLLSWDASVTPTYTVRVR